MWVVGLSGENSHAGVRIVITISTGGAIVLITKVTVCNCFDNESDSLQILQNLPFVADMISIAAQ